MKQITAQHTPGPWASCSGLAKQRYRIETRGTSNDCEPIAECRGPDREANARLIAAAPDLLEALENLYSRAFAQLDRSATHDGLENCNALGDARAAIRKATQD